MSDELAAGSSSDDEFTPLRPRLFGVAYRMTGSVADAEDCCQDAWLRWSRAERATIDNPEAWLVSVTTRLAIDRLRSAQHRRETYVGPYLPEPIVGGAIDAPRPAPGPEAAAELADSLTFAFLVLLDELTPVDRAVLLLHDVFGYSFEEVAVVVDRSPAACRQAASRARRRMHRTDEADDAAAGHDVGRDDGRRASVDERAVVEQLLAAMVTGDVPQLLELLSPDIVHVSDGGPNRRAARRPVVGAERVARLLVNLATRTEAGTTLDLARVNDLPGFVVRVDGRADLVVGVQLDHGGRVERLWAMLNPDKLSHLG